MRHLRVTRRKGREAALQLLCSLDPQGFAQDALAATERFWQVRPTTADARQFAEQLVAGVRQHLEQIDALLIQHLENYQIQRLSLVDRNLLRLALHDILHHPDTPPLIPINEAIEVAKKFGTSDSAAFVNGVLDRTAKSLDIPLRDPRTPPEPPAD